LIAEVVLALVNMWKTADDVSKIKAEDMKAEIERVEKEVEKLKVDYLPDEPA